MNTPVYDFVKAYANSDILRAHMPGHKGMPVLGPEPWDITEINGADELYAARGILLESMKNASLLFGTRSTIYSSEGSSLCIRAMVYLTVLHARSLGRKPVIAAGRNAHKVFVYAAALLDADIRWLYPEDDSYLSCDISPESLDSFLTDNCVSAVYVTSPDYLGNMLDIAALAVICHKHQAILLVDNAHGAYLNFLPVNRHPMALGADMCCDSAHKTLPALTGTAYLHISRSAPTILNENAFRAMSLFASTSPSYLLLQSLDLVNAYLADHFQADLAKTCVQVRKLRCDIEQMGIQTVGTDPLRLTIKTSDPGIGGIALAEIFRKHDIECEFADSEFIVFMLTPQSPAAICERILSVLKELPPASEESIHRPALCRPCRVMSPREALLSPCETIPVEKSLGRVLSCATVSCPPAVPIVVSGERIDDQTINNFRYYGIESCCVVK